MQHQRMQASAAKLAMFQSISNYSIQPACIPQCSLHLPQLQSCDNLHPSTLKFHLTNLEEVVPGETAGFELKEILFFWISLMK